MAALNNYKGLQVITPQPLSGGGGEAINQDFKSLVDWSPRSNWTATVDPINTDDQGSSKNYQVGSRWLNATTGAMFICMDSTVGAAKWRGIPLGSIGLVAWKNGVGSASELFLNGTSQRIVVPNQTLWGFTATSVASTNMAIASPTPISAAWETKGAIKRIGSATSLIGTNQTTKWGDSGTENWTLVLAASSTTNALEITASAPSSSAGFLTNIRLTPLFAGLEELEETEE